MNKNIRNISCNEQLYLDMQDLTNSFAIQYIFEYEGYVDRHKFQNAINYVLKNTDDSNLRLEKNKWVKCENDIKVEIVKYEKELLESELFKTKIDYTTHSLEVYLLENKDKKYIVFRILHSVSDGKGALQFVSNVFDYLKGKEILNHDNSYNEQDIIDEISEHNKGINIFPRYKMNHKIGKVKKSLPRWKNIQINGYHTTIISKIASSLFKSFKNDEVTFMIPTDIRRHLKNNNCLGNMTLPIFLKVSQNDSVENINGKLLYGLKNKEELNKKSTSYIGYQKLNKNARIMILRLIKNILSITKTFSFGGIISYLGRVSLTDYSNDEFKIIDFISLPLQQPFTPFSIVIIETMGKTNITISCYEDQVSKEIFNVISDELEKDIKLAVYNKINSIKQVNVEDCLTKINQNILSQNTKLALEDSINQYTYKELSLGIKRAESILISNKIAKYDRVILYMERSYDFICYMIACMKLGAVFITIDETTSQKRVNDILKDSCAKMIVTNIKNKIYFDNDVTVIDSEQIEDNVKLFNSSDCEHSDTDIVYKIYTSGTTGNPKGIEISYGNLSNYLTWAKETYQVSERCVMPLYTSLSVDLTLTSIFLPLVTGGKIKIIEEAFSQLVLKKIFLDKEINVIKATPTHLSLLEQVDTKNKLEILIVGGENFNQELAANISIMFNGNIKIFNEYGPTETTIGCSFFEYTKTKDVNVPIGKSIANTEIILLDSHNEVIVSENIEGEILISGNSVSQGLIDSNSEKLFKSNEKIFYRTGDLGYIKNGVLHCIGRLDTQIKLNGNRIELDEITNTVLKFNGIKNAACILKESRIILFVCKQEMVKIEDIQNYLKEKLPNYMLPSQIIEINMIPMKESGKIDLEVLKSDIYDDKNSVDITLDIILGADSNSIYEDYTLVMLGLDSLETLKLTQRLADKVNDDERKDDFINAILKNITFMKVTDIRNIIKEYGGIN